MDQNVKIGKNAYCCIFLLKIQHKHMFYLLIIIKRIN